MTKNDDVNLIRFEIRDVRYTLCNIEDLLEYDDKEFFTENLMVAFHALRSAVNRLTVIKDDLGAVLSPLCAKRKNETLIKKDGGDGAAPGMPADAR